MPVPAALRAPAAHGGAAALRRPRRGARAEGDVRLGDPDVGAGIAACLRFKGFCVVEGVVAETDRQDALACIGTGALDFYEPAVLVQDGLLGTEGSTRIAPVLPGDGPASQGLHHLLETAMAQLADSAAAYQHEVGLHCNARSNIHVHRATEAFSDEAELTDAQAFEWYSVFLSRKLMLLINLGPGHGNVELALFDEDADPMELLIAPGMAVVLRTDQMAFGYSARGIKKSCVATSFLLQDDIRLMGPARAAVHATPAAANLGAWIASHLHEMKAGPAKDWDRDALEQRVPRHLVSAASGVFPTEVQTSVCGFGAKLPSTCDPEAFFLASVRGADFVTGVPLERWDHEEHWYDPAPDSAWRGKTPCRHAGFCESLDAFDGRAFGIAREELKDMGTTENQVLECAYDALFRSGMHKHALSNLSCGVYVGMCANEWSNTDCPANASAFAASNSSPSLCAGRLGFCLGFTGENSAVDTDAASGLTCVYLAAKSMEEEGGGNMNDVACAVGVSLLLTAAWWPAHSARGLLSPGGRCFAFDASADGHVRGEAVGCAVLVARPERLADGQQALDDLVPLGRICGARALTNGTAASLTTPRGPAEQALLLDACRASGIQGSDVDLVECHAASTLLADAAEVSSTRHALRAGVRAPLLLGSCKSSLGNTMAANGLVSLHRMMYQLQSGVICSNLHLRGLNPQIYSEGHTPALMHSEVVDSMLMSMFGGVSSHGFSGTMVHVQLFRGFDADMLRLLDPAPSAPAAPRLTYWPGGGGLLDRACRPRRGLFVAGTFNGWQPEPMKDEGEGRHGCVITLGENLWEQFQIWLDGNTSTILHPPSYKAPKGTEVCGPSALDDVSRSLTWLIDARPAQTAGAADAAASNRAARRLALFGGPEEGRPGDRYRIHVHTAGKWRTVTWSRCEADGGAPAGAPPPGRYYVVGWFTDGVPQLMEADEAEPGLFTFRLELPSEQCQFLIYRNEDWTQAFSPETPDAGPDVPVSGPGDAAEGCLWSIRGRYRETFIIEFRRPAGDGSEAARVSWRRPD